MNELIDKAMLIIQPLGLVVMLVYIYGFFGRFDRMAHHVNAIMGGVFGFAAVIAMSFPISIAEGVIVDMRNLMVGLSAAFFGPIGGGIALACAAAARIAIGGSGMVIGLMGMMVAAVMGVMWSRTYRSRHKTYTSAYLVLGLMISAHLLVGLLMPADFRMLFLKNMAPVLLIGNIVGAVLLGKLIARERHLLEEAQQLRREAKIDALTQLLNRKAARAAYDALPQPQRPGRGLAMLCIDVDLFKEINDSYGHLAGDKVLMAIADRLSACLRSNDVVARMSGDEFLIVLHDLTEEQAQVIACRCCKSVGASPIKTRNGLISVSISIGCSWSDEKLPFATFRHMADDALYNAKSTGRARVVMAA